MDWLPDEHPDWRCIIIESDDKHFRTRVSGHIGEANARLIAAAPELLETLSTLLAMCDRQVDFNDDGDGLTLERARVLLAKVKGKA